MMFVDFDLVSGGDVLINPEQVAALLPRPEGGTLIRLIGRSDDIAVCEHVGDVVEGFKAAVR